MPITSRSECAVEDDLKSDRRSVRGRVRRRRTNVGAGDGAGKRHARRSGFSLTAAARRPYPSSVTTLDRDHALTLYRTLLLARAADERIRVEYFRDEMKTP